MKGAFIQGKHNDDRLRYNGLEVNSTLLETVGLKK